MVTNQQRLKAWFSQCIAETTDSLYAMALRLTKDNTDAEDLVAESVVKAWSSIHTLEDARRFRPWIFCILRNLFFSQCRKKSVRPRESTYDETETDGGASEIASLLVEQPDEFLHWWANPEREFVNNLLGEEIMQAIYELPEIFQETVLLINLAGLSYDEAAEVLNVSPGTIRSRMNRGRTMLQKVLWQHASDAGFTTGNVMQET